MVYSVFFRHLESLELLLQLSVFTLNLKDVLGVIWQPVSCLMGKPTICIGENKDADQLRGNREADQRLCFRYLDSTIPLLLKSKISSL